MVKVNTKKPKKPASKSVSSSKPSKEKEVKPVQPEVTPSPESKPATPKTKEINMDKETIQLAITHGQNLLKAGKSKADAARAIFELIHGESRDVVIEAFIQGATITPKGAPTYYYNVSRKFKKTKSQNEPAPEGVPN